MSKEKKSFLIVGLGRFGISLCEKLIELGQSVIGVDQLAGPVAEMSEKIDVAAQLDVSDESALIKVGAKEVDIAIVTIGASLRTAFSVPQYWSTSVSLLWLQERTRASREDTCQSGAHRIVFPEWDMGHKGAENFVYPWYSKFTKIDGGDFYFGKIKPLPEMVGKTMAELKFSQRYKVIVILLEHEGKQESPSPIRPFLETDGLWVLGRRSDMDELVTKSDLEGK